MQKYTHIGIHMPIIGIHDILLFQESVLFRFSVYVYTCIYMVLKKTLYLLLKAFFT